MPCPLEKDTRIHLADYGNSFTGQLKTLYRQGLHHRYGDAMQMIAGLHFNFSFSEAFGRHCIKHMVNVSLQTFQDEQYFKLIQTFQEISWVIPYLFGASPAVAKAFEGVEQSNTTVTAYGRKSLQLTLCNIIAHE